MSVLAVLAIIGAVGFGGFKLVFHIVYGWCEPEKREEGYIVSVESKNKKTYEFPEKILSTPVVGVYIFQNSETQSNYYFIPDLVKKLYVSAREYGVQYIGPSGTNPKGNDRMSSLHGVYVPEQVEYLTYLNTLNNTRMKTSFYFDSARMLSELELTNIYIDNEISLEELSGLSTMDFLNTYASAVTLPRDANVFFKMMDSNAGRIIIPENAKIEKLLLSDGTYSSIGWIEFPQTGHLGIILVTITGKGELIIPDGCRIDELDLYRCQGLSGIIVGEGVAETSIYDSTAEYVIVKGAKDYLRVSSNPSLTKLEIFSECDNVNIVDNAALEEITVWNTAPENLTIAESDGNTVNSIKLIRVPADAVEAYREHFSSIFPVIITEISE